MCSREAEEEYQELLPLCPSGDNIYILEFESLSAVDQRQIRSVTSLFIIITSTPIIGILFHTSNIVSAKTTPTSSSSTLIPFAKFNVQNSCLDHLCLPTDIVWTGSRFILSTVPGNALYTVSSNGTSFSAFTATDCFVTGEESYMAITGPQNYRFGVGNLYVAKGGVIWKIDPTGKECTIFSNITGPFVGGMEHSQLSHTGLVFDKEGSFDNNLLAATDDGSIWKLDYRGNFKLLASGSLVGGRPECIDVASKDFGPYSSKLIVGSEKTGRISAIANNGAFSAVLNYPLRPEHCSFLPHYISIANPLNGMYIVTANNEPRGGVSFILKIPSSSFTPFNGSLLLTNEYSSRDIKVITYDQASGNYTLQSIASGISIGPNVKTALEGFAFVNNKDQVAD
jgi:hypothetical protein